MPNEVLPLSMSKLLITLNPQGVTALLLLRQRALNRDKIF